MTLTQKALDQLLGSNTVSFYLNDYDLWIYQKRVSRLIKRLAKQARIM